MGFRPSRTKPEAREGNSYFNRATFALAAAGVTVSITGTAAGKAPENLPGYLWLAGWLVQPGKRPHRPQTVRKGAGDVVVDCFYILWRYSPLSSRLAALLSHATLNE